jgi:hypothetical protein
MAEGGMQLDTKEKNTQRLCEALLEHIDVNGNYKKMINSGGLSKKDFHANMVKHLVENTTNPEERKLWNVKGLNHLGEKIDKVLDADCDRKLPVTVVMSLLSQFSRLRRPRGLDDQCADRSHSAVSEPENRRIAGKQSRQDQGGKSNEKKA